MKRVLSRFSAFWGDERGQAMLETALLVPALLALFLGLWQHVLLELAQTRSILAARHLAWASSFLHEGTEAAKKRANDFFPANATLSVEVEGYSVTNDMRNLAAAVGAILAKPDEGEEWSRATVKADLPVLPHAAPLPLGGTGELGKVLSLPTREENCWAVNRSTDTRAYFVKAFALPILRADLTLGKMGPRILMDYLLDKLKEAVFGEMDDETENMLSLLIDGLIEPIKRIIEEILD
jgi:hypothetical protein